MDLETLGFSLRAWVGRIVAVSLFTNF